MKLDFYSDISSITPPYFTWVKKCESWPRFLTSLDFEFELPAFQTEARYLKSEFGPRTPENRPEILPPF